MSTLPSLSSKTALVLGGSRGIGAAIVSRLASDGAQVAFTYAASEGEAVALEGELKVYGHRVKRLRADSADPEAVKGAVAKTVQAFGGLDILVCNAGILIPGSVETYSLDDFDRMVAINVKSVFVATQAACAHMGPGGRVIVIGSIVAARTGFPGISVYGMTKAALASLVRGMAIDLAPAAITVNTVQPGPTITDMNPADGPMAETILGMIPLGRMAEAKEIAGLVAYLSAPESSFVTGATLTIDGGATA